MNREEINKLISDYESKWGKLGAGNSILNPEKTAISHSGLNSSNNFYGGKRKMLNMTNDYYEFRRKVAEGKNKNKLAHAATVNIDEINRQYWEKINTDGTLIHAGGRYVPDYEEDDDYLEHADRNVKYYQKLDLGNGNYRYFYTKEEWDAYQNAKHAENERKKQGSISTEFKIKKSGEALGKAAKNAFGKLANANEYKKNEEYSKYAEEDRQTDMADERERKAVLKKFKKEMLPIPDDMGVEAKKLVDKYIETGDPDDLSALEKALSPELRGNLQGRLLSLQKESFMGNKIRKDGSLRKMSHSFEEDDDYLEHAENVKYYQKIKLPNGKIRYFYTREEWDAYQNNEKSNEMEEKRNSETPEGRMKNIAKNALSNPLRTTKDILAANQQRAKEEKWAKRRKIIMDAASNKMSHSFEDDDDFDTGVMSEYRAFKARANRGAEMNRLSHSSFISPNELNERYEEEIASHCFLAHAGGYGAPSGTNAYVAKIDNFYGQGKPRYFYTQEEWNAYQRNAKGASQAGADRASKETAAGVRQNQINNAQKRTAENQRLESQRKNAEAAQNAGADRSEKETGMDVTRQKQVADAKKAIAKREADAKAKEQSANQAGSAKQGEAEGKAYEEYQKQQKEKLAQERKEKAEKTIADRDAAIKAGQKSEQDRQAKEEQLKKNLDSINTLNHETEILNDKKKSKSDYNYGVMKNIQDEMQEGASKWMEKNGRQNYQEFVEEFNKAAKDYGYDAKLIGNGDYTIHPDGDTSLKEVDKCYSDIDKYKKNIDDCVNKLHNNSNKYDKASLKEEMALYERDIAKLECRIQDLYLKNDQECKKVFDEILNHMNNDIQYEKKLYENVLKEDTLKEVKHSALDELNDFKARVALGKEKNRLAHSRMISLTELQHAASSRYGAPSGTNKYYAKLDDFYGKGKTRYFYSKAEWDAYQNNMKGAQNADRQKNDQSYRDQNKSFEENRRKNEEAAIGREKEQQAQSYTVKKALEENRRKNEGYAQNAEKDRSKSIISKIRDELKNAPTDIKDAPKPEDKPEITTKVENKVTQETKQENRNIEQEATDYAVNVINAIVEDETVQAYFNNACWHNVFGDSEGQMKEWNQIYDTEIAPRIDATINEAYQLYGPEYAAMLDQQIANLYEQMKLEYTTAYLSQRMALYGY